MAQLISGPGVGLPANQYLYPSELSPANVPPDFASNKISLSPGDALPIPAGRWYVNPGLYSFIQFLDPTTGVWRSFNAARGQPQVIVSDGFTRRVANLTGCAVAAVVQGGGSAYVAASTTITAVTGGGSTWQPIVGGQLSVTAVGASVQGSGYGVAPLLFIPAPPNPGVQATAKATISAGTVASVTLTNVGAGYTTAPTITVVTNPTDPNIATVTAATINGVALVNSGVIAAALCTNPGAPLASAAQITLTPAGVGTSASVAAVVIQSCTAISVVQGRDGWGSTTEAAKITSVGGTPLPQIAPAYTNPDIELTNFVPRDLQARGTIAGASIINASVIYDGGLFACIGTGLPTAVIIPGNGALQTTAASVSLTLGPIVDTITIQQL